MVFVTVAKFISIARNVIFLWLRQAEAMELEKMKTRGYHKTRSMRLQHVIQIDCCCFLQLENQTLIEFELA